MRALSGLLCLVVAGCAPKPPAPALTAVEPSFFDGAQGTGLTFIAEGLVPSATLDFDAPAKSSMQPAVVSAFVDDGTSRVEVLDVQWVDATRVTGRLAGPVAVGLYDVHLIEPRGAELILTGALEALDCSEGDCPLPDGGIPDSGVVACTATSYRDRDLDGYGSGASRMVCGPGWVPLSGDCEDRDALTFPGSAEVCNGLDDDCNSVIDDGCGDAGWTALDELRSPANDFVVASSYAPGSLWLGGGSKVFLHRQGLGFSDVSASCPSNLTALWSEPGGEVELGGGTSGAGRLASQSSSTVSCGNERLVNEPPVAMTGFLTGAEYEYVAVFKDGQLLRWKRGQAPTLSPSNLSSDEEVTDLHGSSPDQLIAVGSGLQGNNRRPRAWLLGDDGRWLEESLTGFGNPNGRMLGVWVLSPADAIAVGEAGRLFRRSASGWRALSADTTSALTSVRAFSAGRFYVTTSDGRVRLRSGVTWQNVFRNDAGVPFTDLTGTSEEDLWAVGNDGVIAHGHR